jgi:predicted nucleotidyltransferase
MDAARRPSQFNILWPSEGVKADIMVFRDTPFDNSRLSRARRVDVPGVGSVMVAAPEDIILKKLEFFREGGSDKHVRDITSVLKSQKASIDLAYIERWALRTGVQDQWVMIKGRLGIVYPPVNDSSQP